MLASHVSCVKRISQRCLPFLILDLRLYIVDGIRGFHLQCDSLTREGLDEDLHPPTETEN